jgi:predicted RNA binding protein YcfA (HicA-like mRNA interferase family)
MERLGFVVRRQRGSHVTMRHPETRRMCVIPSHRSVDRRTLGSALEQAGIELEDFLAALRD